MVLTTLLDRTIHTPLDLRYELEFGAIQAAEFLSSQEKDAIFTTNYKAVLDGSL